MTVRGGSSNPSSLKYQALMNKQSIFENELFKPETNQLNIISTHTEDLVLLQDPFMFRKLQTKTQHYKGGWEPDGVYLKLWVRFNHIATQMKDYAFSINTSIYPFNPGNVIRPVGNPLLCKGPDDGVKGGTIVCKINWKPDNLDYFYVLNPDEGQLGIAETTTGFSLAFEFMLDGDPVQHNGEDPTLWFHIDDNNGDYGTMLKVGVNRELKFFVRNSGTTFNFISANNKVTPGVYHTACVTYNPTGNVLTMKIDDELQVDSANETPTFPAGHENSVFLGIGTDANAGRFVGRFKDARWYRNLIFNDDHQTNLWNTKRSICAANVVNFNGTTDYVDLAAQTAIWSKNMDKFSFSIWFYPTATYDVDYRNIVAIGDGNDSFSLGFTNQVGNVLGFSMTKDAYASEGTINYSGLTILKKWYNAICTYDKTLGSQNVKMYIDGALVGTANYAFTIAISAAAKMLLGRFELDPASTFHFSGQQKDFRFWDNVELTQAQVIAVRDNRTDALLPTYWLKMNEGNSNPTDWITRTKVGTLTGGASWAIGSSPRPTQFGSLAVAGYSRFNDTVDTSGYDAVGYDTTGFDAS